MDGYSEVIAAVKKDGYDAYTLLDEQYRLYLENAVVIYADLGSIDWLWGWHELYGNVDAFSQFVLLMLVHKGGYVTDRLEWYFYKKPVPDWCGSGVWYAATRVAARNWINKKTPIQDLVIRNTKYCNKKIFVTAAYSLMQLGLNSRLDTVLLSKAIAYDKPSILWALVKRDRKLVRETILADGGKVLRAARKKIKRILPQILSLSDYVSVGLPPPWCN
jgi:hypothetical protein